MILLQTVFFISLFFEPLSKKRSDCPTYVWCIYRISIQFQYVLRESNLLFSFIYSTSFFGAPGEEKDRATRKISIDFVNSMPKEEKAAFLYTQRRDDYLVVRDLIKPRGIYVKRIRTVCLRSQTELPPWSRP